MYRQDGSRGETAELSRHTRRRNGHAVEGRAGALQLGEMTDRRALPLFAVACLLFTLSAFGQAIVLDRGQSTFGLAYQHTFVRYHIGFDGTKYDLGHIMAYTIRPEASYGVTDRVTVDGDVAFSAAKYI